MNWPLERLKKAAISIAAQIDVPPRPEQRVAVPESIARGPLGAWLDTSLGTSALWSHQAQAIETLMRGENLCLSTSTGSGKTLPLHAGAIHHLLSGQGVVLVLYPSKALASDQWLRWRTALAAAGFDPDCAAVLSGDVPMAARDAAITCARVILATPDIVQAWLMSQLANPMIRKFIARLSLLILDEAHCYEHIFGSNQAYLMRRLRAACASARAASPIADLPPFQILAATGTVLDAAAHLEQLTGLPFIEIGEDRSGAPRAPHSVLHILGPDRGSQLEAFSQALLEELLTESRRDTIILFMDSRQGVERIASRLKRADVFAYRSGYEDADRHQIEAALRAGKCRAIISTSALELGIDIPHFVIGLIVGLPATKKQFRQRVGRVGRAGPGVCALIAPATVFSQVGSSLADYWESSVEPSHLYLDNPFIQFGHARCLIEECDAMDGELRLPDSVAWPQGFSDTFELARPGAIRPRMFDAVANMGGDSPHHNFPLRQIGETRFKLRLASGGDGEPLGTISHQQALREAYPGAMHLHAGRCYRVREWRNIPHDRSIRLDPVKNGVRTDALIYKTVNLSVADEGLVDGRLMSGEAGSLAEVQLQICEGVEGYRIGKTTLLYRDLRQTNSAMTRKQYEFGTTGVLVQIDAPWFAGTSQIALNNRRAIARALRQILLHDRSISASEVDFADSNIAWWQGAGPRRRTDCLVIYDCVYGGFRLTESLFAQFPHYLERLARAGALIGSEAMLSGAMVDRLADWFDSLKPATSSAVPMLDVERQGEDYVIFAPNSQVAIMHNGVLSPRTLCEPHIMSLGAEDLLMYRYEAGGGASAYVAHDRIHPIGQDWRRALWDPRSNIVRELDQ